MTFTPYNRPVRAAFIGLGTVTSSSLLTAWSYVGITLATLAWAFVRRGLRLVDGVVIVVAYVAFVVVLLR